MVIQVRHDSWYISLPSSIKHQRDMTSSTLSRESEPRRLLFYFYFKCFRPVPDSVSVILRNKENGFRVSRDSKVN